ncbi:dihydrofolate reductase [Clostridium sp. DL-VIII]|nr:dihydrofolate reductase [Clostridium sp. DL-VIII]
MTVKSLAKAFKLTEDEEEVFVAGGVQVYEEAFPYADRIYITVIHKK